MAPDHSFKDPRNRAYILLLIRNGVVNNRADLARHLGRNPNDTGSLDIGHALDLLHAAGLIEFDGDVIKITSLSAKIQTNLQFSLSALASGPLDHRLIVSPRYETYEAERYRSDILVLMPFTEVLTALYEDHLKDVAQVLQLTIARADDFFTSGRIMNAVWTAIVKAKVLIADCTGRNPNVFYEIGLAHALGKPVILIAQTPEDVPFDLSQYRYIEYEFTPRGMLGFEKTLCQTLKSTFKDEDASHELRPF